MGVACLRTGLVTGKFGQTWFLKQSKKSLFSGWRLKGGKNTTAWATWEGKHLIWTFNTRNSEKERETSYCRHLEPGRKDCCDYEASSRPDSDPDPCLCSALTYLVLITPEWVCAFVTWTIDRSDHVCFWGQWTAALLSDQMQKTAKNDCRCTLREEPEQKHCIATPWQPLSDTLETT